MAEQFKQDRVLDRLSEQQQLERLRRDNAAIMANAKAYCKKRAERQEKWKKYAEAWRLLPHNLIAHPLAAICYVLTLYKFGLWLHNITLPRERQIK